jgi:hypothetical protein
MARAQLNYLVTTSVNGVVQVVNDAAITIRRVRDNSLATLYAASTGSVPVPNPIRTDSGGRATAWLEAGEYLLLIESERFNPYSEYWESIPADSLADAAKGYVRHGDVANVARPSGFASVEWVGSVKPLNAISTDTWVTQEGGITNLSNAEGELDYTAWAMLATSFLQNAVLVHVDTGAPRYANMIWPDGSLGSYIATALSTDNQRVDAYTVTHRAFAAPHGLLTWRNYIGFAPMSDADAAAQVIRVPEVRPENTGRNNYVPSDSQLAAMRVADQTAAGWSPSTVNPYLQYVTGRIGLTNPTTDEIIQWASWKWGIPTDLLRAEAHLESRWSMDFLGDRRTVTPEVYLQHPPQARIPSTNDVYQSLGFMQVQWTPDGSLGPGSDPLRYLSTPFNIDYACSFIRFHLDDPLGHRTNWGDGTYFAGDYDHAQGGWFQPYPWLNSGQLSYVSQIATRMQTRPWIVAEFSTVNSDITLYTQPTISRSGNGSILDRPAITAGPFTGYSPPGTPTGVTATAGDGSVTLNWTPPAETGAPIGFYRFTNVEFGWTLDTDYAGQRPYTMTGLTNGVEHTFTVRAVNVLGVEGPQSAPGPTVIPNPPGPPSAPRNVTGVAGNTKVTLDWDAPFSDGGSTITGYRIIPRIAGVSQSPILTGSGTPGPYAVTGLTNGTAYTFYVQAINVAGSSGNSVESAAITPVPPAGMDIPPVFPIFSRGLAAEGSGDGVATNATNVNGGDLYRSFPVIPGSGGPNPARIAIDIRGVASGVKTNVWCVMRNGTRSSWNRTGALGVGGVGTSKPRNYKLQGHTSSGASAPGVDDVGWVDLVTVTDNRWSDRIHTGLDLHTYGWFQVRVSECTGSSGNNDFGIHELELRDASGGTQDSIMVYGDSMVAEGMWFRVLDGSAYPAGHGPWEDLVETDAGRVKPAIWMMAEGGYNSVTSVTDFGGRPEFKTIIDANPCHWLYLQWGIADANNVSADMNTLSPAGVLSTPAVQWKTRLQDIIDYAVTAGKQVILPYMVASHNNVYTKPNIIILNQIIDQLVSDNPGTVFLGPDLFTFFNDNPTAFYDTLHPSWDPSAPALPGGLSGYEHMIATIGQWFADNLYS